MKEITNCSPTEIKKAAQALKAGYLVAFPTETVYGIGADANNYEAVQRIYSIKGRPIDHPLIVHVSSTNQLSKWARDVPNYAVKLAETFWPGPITLVLKKSELAKSFVTGGQDTIGIRIPNQAFTLNLLQEFEALGGFGVAAPSANKFGAVSPTTAHAVQEEIGNELGQQDFILDGGGCEIGIESTIIDCTQAEPSILRPGIVTKSMISKLSLKKSAGSKNKIPLRTPGSMRSHYSPKAKVVINSNPKPGEGLLALFSEPTPEGVIRLGAPENLEEFARLLYSSLRLADTYRLSQIVVNITPEDDLAKAILDRLIKAAH